MMLYCRYGTDPSDPEAGFVFAHHDDGALPPAGSYPGCTAVPYAGRVEDLDRFGPAPAEGEHDWRPRAAPRLDLAVARSAKLAELSDRCGAAIAAGFTSSALGAANLYPSADEDQRNLSLAAGAALTGQSTAGWTTPLKCGPAGQRAARQPHTAGQVHAALGDFVACKAAATDKLDALKAKVAAADTPDAVAALAWG